jgi:GR25 family glycosyltransferase involved in LPS biosynthesis
MWLPPVYIINLEKRSDRWLKCEKEMIKTWMEFQKFQACEDLQFPYFWCSKSHKEILKIAKNKKYEMVCVFEDDVKIYQPKKIWDYLKKILNQMPSDWHILYLGWLVGRESTFKKTGDNLFKINNIYCTYGILYNHRSYDNIIEAIADYHNGDVSRTKIWNELKIDDWLAKVYQEKYPCYITNKLLVGQQKSLSSISGDMTNLDTKYQLRFLFYSHRGWWILKILGRIKDAILGVF